jgi:hypothetical protein
MTDLSVPAAPDRGATTTGVSRWQMAVGGLGLVVALWVGAQSPLYEAWFTDGGGTGHGPGGGPQPTVEAPEGNQEQGPAPSGGPHDPSQFEHGRP